MIGIHRIQAIEARVSTLTDSHWLELTLTDPSGETTVIDLYFSSPNKGFEEERRFAVALCDAINSIPPIQDLREAEPDEAA